MAYDENFLRRTYGSGQSDAQNQQINALRMDAMRQQQEQSEQRFTQQQQLENTRRLLGAIPIIRNDPQSLPRVLDDLVTNGIVYQEQAPRILQAAQANPEAFTQTLDSLEQSLQTALGQFQSGRVSKTWVNPETGTMWGMTATGQAYDTGVKAQQFAMRPIETAGGTAPFDPARGDVAGVIPGTEAEAMRSRESADAAAKAGAVAEVQAGVEQNTQADANRRTLEVWDVARQGLISALEGTVTGPVAGRIPAVTSPQQTAEGAIAAVAPVLKQLFRSAGEGIFTDRDQQLLLDMVPKRTDHPETRISKMAMIDAIIQAKLGTSQQQPQDQPTVQPTGRTATNPNTGQQVMEMSDGTWQPVQ